MHCIALVSSGERNPRDDILTRLATVLDEVGTTRIRHENKILTQKSKDLIRSVGLGQTSLQRCRSVRISETGDGRWKAEEDCKEDGVIIYLAINFHQQDPPLVKYGLGFY